MRLFFTFFLGLSYQAVRARVRICGRMELEYGIERAGNCAVRTADCAE